MRGGDMEPEQTIAQSLAAENEFWQQEDRAEEWAASLSRPQS